MDKNPVASNAPYLIVGLGNPGSKYATTRHNVGFMVVDEAASRYGMRFSGKQGNAEIARGEIKGQKVILVKPQTFMNNSGQAVRALASFYKVPNDRVLIIYDEIALPVGTIRMRTQGSSAGHNGVKSVIAHMGTEAIPRIRVGVDRPADPRHSQIDWVLGHFTREERTLIDETISRTVDAVEAIFTIGMERAMNAYNIAPSEETKDEGRKKPIPKGTPHGPSTKVQPPSPKSAPDLSMDAMREKIARIIRNDEK